MSIKRYIAKMPWTQIETQEHPNGEFVLHSDYARLKAKVEMLESDNLKLKDDIERQIEARNYFIHKMMLNIKHVDMLTSAGDNLQNTLLKLTSGTPDWNKETFWKWNAAKEGKQP